MSSSFFPSLLSKARWSFEDVRPCTPAGPEFTRGCRYSHRPAVMPMCSDALYSPRQRIIMGISSKRASRLCTVSSPLVRFHVSHSTAFSTINGMLQCTLLIAFRCLTHSMSEPKDSSIKHRLDHSKTSEACSANHIVLVSGQQGPTIRAGIDVSPPLTSAQSNRRRSTPEHWFNSFGSFVS